MRQTNFQIFVIFVVQIVLAGIGASFGATWTQKNIPYLHNSDTQKFSILFTSLTGTWILIFTNFVPISLLVTLEVVKFW
jgi:phospholipid-transporting ATPase